MFPSNRDKFLLIGLRTLAAISVSSLLFILFYLIKETIPVFQSVESLRFFTDSSWHPMSGEYLLLPMIIGSLFIMFGAMLFSVPIGIFTAILSRFYAPVWFSKILHRIVEILSGIPSVIYGFLGIIVIVPFLAEFEAPGTSVLAGIIVLSFIVLPNIVLISNSALSQIDPVYINNAMSLGLSRYAIIRHVILPQSKSGLFTGIVLQSGRAIGETLAVLMVCGNVVQIPGSIFEPVRTLTSNIALEMAYAMDDHRSALFLSGLLLMGVVLIIILIAERISPQENTL